MIHPKARRASINVELKTGLMILLCSSLVKPRKKPVELLSTQARDYKPSRAGYPIQLQLLDATTELENLEALIDGFELVTSTTRVAHSVARAEQLSKPQQGVSTFQSGSRQIF